MGGKIEQLKSAGFTHDQIEQIGLGRKSGVDVSVYAYPYFPAIQMYQIRLALEEHLPIEPYASREYDWFQVEEIRKGFLSKVDIEKYAQPAIPYEVMRQIRMGLEEGVDLSPFKSLPAGVLREVRLSLVSGVKIVPFISAGYSEEQLEEIRLSLEHKVDITPYLNKLFRGDSLREIREGLEEGLDVAQYAKIDYDWHQMQEIRLGLESQLDVSVYAKPLFGWREMQEIRTGLEEGIPPEIYANLMYTAREMRKRRIAFLERRGKIARYDESASYTGDVAVAISINGMEASLIFSGNKKKWTLEELQNVIKASGITYGVNYSTLDGICRREVGQEKVVIAKGLPPENGKDGWYEYFFKTPVNRVPESKADGSLNYQSVAWFVYTQKGKRLALYHPAEKGTPGRSVLGKDIVAEAGKELKVLNGSGFLVSKDKRTYVAATAGEVSVENGRLMVRKLLVLPEVARKDGDVVSDGSILVHGKIESGVSIQAKGDIVVEGSVGGADLRAEGNIFLMKGCNATLGRARLYADGNITGDSFTEAVISTKKDFFATTCLGCKIEAESWVRLAGSGSSITGGTLYGAFGVEAETIGSTGGASALIMTGVRPDFYGYMQDTQNSIDRVEKELELLNRACDEVRKKLLPEERNKNSMFLKLEQAVYTKELEKKELEQHKMVLSSEEKSFVNSSIIVHDTLHEGTDVDIGGTRTKIKVDMHNVTLKKNRGIIISKNNG